MVYLKSLASAFAIILGIGIVVQLLMTMQFLDEGDPVSHAYEVLVFVWLVERCERYFANKAAQQKTADG